MGYFGIPFRNGVPIGLGSIAGFGAPQEFSPFELFPSGTAGTWYDPSDLTTMFTTSAGTTPVAMPGQGSAVSVGRMLDKSGNGNHAIAINDSTARPELRARVNLLVATATLSTQSVTTQATSYTLRFAGTGSITLSGTATGTYSAGTHTITCTAGTLTLTVSGTVTTADLRPANAGALLPAYQAVTDANTYDTAGFPLYLRFDGIDDGMYTPANLNLSATDKVGVFAGVRKLAAGAQQLVELSISVSANDGSFSMPSDSGTGTWATASKGTNLFVLAQSATNSYVAPVTTINTGLHDLSLATDVARLRVNGAQVATSGVGAGGGNFGTYPLNIGVRSAASSPSLYFNGHLHGLIVVGSAVSAGNISATESWMAGKTGIVI